MQQLSGVDASFLNMETPTTYGHVSSLTTYEASDRTGLETLEAIRQTISERLHLMPLFRRRLAWRLSGLVYR